MTALEVTSVWKQYPRWLPGTRSVRSVLTPSMRALRRSSTKRWALQDVSLSLEQGSSIGVVGHNGAGKSTLLRLVSGLGTPTKGRILVSPNSASILSLGDTLSPELTGRENATTIAVVAGLPLAEARAALPSMLEFAELEGFEDAPVRSYSEGMKLRLAFGALTVFRPHLLILDEVLAVGDVSFQRKCLDHIYGLRERGTAVLLASHDLETIAAECDQAIWLDRGQARGFGPAERVIDDYRSAMESATLAVTPTIADTATEGLVLHENRLGSQEVQIEDVRIRADGMANEVRPGQSLEITFTLRSPMPRRDLAVSIAVTRPEGDVTCIDINSELDSVTIPEVGPQGTTLSMFLDDLELQPGAYFVDVGVFPRTWDHALDYHWHAHPLTVIGHLEDSKPVFQPKRRRWNVADGV